MTCISIYTSEYTVIIYIRIVFHPLVDILFHYTSFFVPVYVFILFMILICLVQCSLHFLALYPWRILLTMNLYIGFKSKLNMGV